MTVFYTDLLKNYISYPILFLEPIAAVIFLLGIRFYLSEKQYFKAWLSSGLGIVCIVFFGIIGLYPTMFPSSLDKTYSLTAHNASCSPPTLKIMLIVVILFVPHSPFVSGLGLYGIYAAPEGGGSIQLSRIHRSYPGQPNGFSWPACIQDNYGLQTSHTFPTSSGPGLRVV